MGECKTGLNDISGAYSGPPDLHEGVEYVVRIVGYDDERNEVLSKTITVLGSG